MPLFRFTSIYSYFAAAFAVLIVMTCAGLGFSAYQLSTNAAARTAQTYTSELIKQVNANLQSYISNMEHVSSLAMNNRSVKEYLFAPGEGTHEETIDFFQTIASSRKDIASISMFVPDGRWVSSRTDAELNPNLMVSEQPWYQMAAEADGQVIISSSHVQRLFRDEFRWVVSLSREIRQPGSSDTAGILLVNLNFSVLNDLFDQIDLGRRGYVFIVDDKGSLVYHPQQQLIYSGLKQEPISEVLASEEGSFIAGEAGAKRIYTIQDSGFGWKIAGVSYVSELVGNKADMQLSFLALGIIGLLLAMGVSLVLSRKLSRPIRQLQEYMKEAERGNFDIQVPVDHTRELGRLARTFNMMMQQIKELMKQVVREQEIKRKNELSALQAQINPHFLYNTLDSIIWMAESKRSEEVVVMTSALARLFRASISKGSELVSIRTEMEHITNYLTIQKMRYNDKLDFTIDIPQHLWGYVTPKVLLQPLVENAIYHGIKNKPGCGVITVEGWESGEQIVFRVSDNGVGMDAKRLAAILEPRVEGEAKGIGVANVHERIRLSFGYGYGLRFESELDEGTRVYVTIPRLTAAPMKGGEGDAR